MKSPEAPAKQRSGKKFELTFPEGAGSLAQDQEWCVVETESETKRIRFHDYAQIFSEEGLYEHLFYETLECCSPRVVCDLLEDTIEDVDESVSIADLTVLDVGAGNGMVGEQLRERGVGEIVGVDLIPEASQAAKRDRPGVYDEYLVEDLTDLSDRSREELEGRKFNCLTSVAALGFGDIPPDAFAEAFNLVEGQGWVAFNIRDKFLETDESSGFSRLIERMVDGGVLVRVQRKRYRHRLSMNREPLYYYAFSAQKTADIPAEWLNNGVHEESVA